MRRILSTFVIASTIAIPTAASARPLQVIPVSSEKVTSRFNKGVPTLQIDDELTTVTVTPRELNRGRLSFAVAAFNKAPTSFNMGVESVSASLADGSSLRIFSKDDLVRQAKNRAMWAQIGVAVVAGLGAAAAASSAGHRTYNSTLATPHGFYRYTATYTNHAEAALASAAVAGTGAFAIASIQDGLDKLVADLGENVLQTTTVDRGSGYGGIIVLDKLKAKPAKGKPVPVTLTVNLNGRAYPFAFDVTR